MPPEPDRQIAAALGVGEHHRQSGATRPPHPERAVDVPRLGGGQGVRARRQVAERESPIGRRHHPPRPGERDNGAADALTGGDVDDLANDEPGARRERRWGSRLCRRYKGQHQERDDGTKGSPKTRHTLLLGTGRPVKGCVDDSAECGGGPVAGAGYFLTQPPILYDEQRSVVPPQLKVNVGCGVAEGCQRCESDEGFGSRLPLQVREGPGKNPPLVTSECYHAPGQERLT